MIRCARCWATAKQVSVWRYFGVGLRDNVVCCIADLRERF